MVFRPFDVSADGLRIVPNCSSQTDLTLWKSADRHREVLILGKHAPDFPINTDSRKCARAKIREETHELLSRSHLLSPTFPHQQSRSSDHHGTRLFGAMMIAYCPLTFALVALVSLVSTAFAGQDFRGQIQPNAALIHLLNLGPNTRVLLHAVPPQQTATAGEQSGVVTAPATSSNNSLDLAAFGLQHDRSTLVAVDGSFIFRNLDQGAYILEIVSRTHAFEKYRIDVLDPSLGKAPQIRVFTP